MKKNFSAVFLLLMSLFITLSMSKAFGFLIPEPVYHNSARAIQVSIAEPNFVISLPANRTTGYSWKVTQYDSKILTLAETKYVPSPSQLVGAGGFSKWTFEVNPALLDSHTPFETSIVLTYARPWESSNNNNTKTVVFTVMYGIKPEGTNRK